MGFLIFVVVAVIVMFCIGGWIAIAMIMQQGSQLKRHEKVAEETMDGLFDGSQQVTYAAPDSSGGLPLPRLIDGAGERGYDLVQEAGGNGAGRRVIFRQRQSA